MRGASLSVRIVGVEALVSTVTEHPMSKRNAQRPITPLRQRMIEDMTIRNLSATTQASYVHAVKLFARHFGRSPDQAASEDIRAYQLHLVHRKVASRPARLRHDGDAEPGRIVASFSRRWPWLRPRSP